MRRFEVAVKGCDILQHELLSEQAFLRTWSLEGTGAGVPVGHEMYSTCSVVRRRNDLGGSKGLDFWHCKMGGRKNR